MWPKIDGCYKTAHYAVMNRQSPDEIQGLVFVPDSPASPALIQKMPVVLGAMRLNWVSALVATLMKRRGKKRMLQEEF